MAPTAPTRTRLIELLAFVCASPALAACAAGRPSPSVPPTGSAGPAVAAEALVPLKVVLWEALSAQDRRAEYTAEVDSLRLFPAPGVRLQLLLDTVLVELTSYPSTFSVGRFEVDTMPGAPVDTALADWADPVRDTVPDSIQPGGTSDGSEPLTELVPKPALLMVAADPANSLTCATAIGPVDPSRAPSLQDVLDVDDGIVCGRAAAGVGRDPAEVARRHLIALVLAQEGARERPLELDDLSPKPGSYAETLRGVPGFTPNSAVEVELLGGSPTGWAAAAVHRTAPGVRCIVWVGMGGRALAERSSLQVGEAGQPWCGPNTSLEALAWARLSDVREALHRLVVLQEGAASRFGGYTASPLRLRQMGIFELEGYAGYRAERHISVRIAEATPAAWAAEAAHDSVPGFVCRVRTGPVTAWSTESLTGLSEGIAMCTRGTLSTRLPTVDPIEAMRGSLLNYLQQTWGQIYCEADNDATCFDPRVRVRVLQEDSISFAAEATHVELQNFSCVISVGGVEQRPTTERDTLMGNEGEVVCDGDIAPGTPESALFANQAMKGDLRRLIVTDLQVRQADSTDYVPSLERLVRAGFQPTPGVQIRVLAARMEGELAFSAEARFPAMLPGKSCVVYLTNSPESQLPLPATVESGRVPDLAGIPVCDRP